MRSDEADSDMQSQLAADPRPNRLGRTSPPTSAERDSERSASCKQRASAGTSSAPSPGATRFPIPSHAGAAGVAAEVGISICLLEDLQGNGPFAPIFLDARDPSRAVDWLGGDGREAKEKQR